MQALFDCNWGIIKLMKKELWPIFLVVFIGLLGFGIVIPTLPFIALKYRASPFMIGLLMASYSLFQFLAAPVLGQLSDKYGRKPILAISLFGSALGYFLIAVANNIWLIFVSRIIDGVTGGNISVAQAYIADITQGKERTKAMGLIGMAFGLGFILGPFVGGVLGNYNLALPYLFAGGLAFLNSIFIATILPETRKIASHQKFSLIDLKTLKKISQNPQLKKLVLLFFATTLAFSLMQGIFAIYTKDMFNWNQKQVGYFFAYIGLVSVFSQGYLIRKLVDKFSETRLLKTALFIRSGAFLIYALLVQPALFYLGGLAMALGMGIFNPTVQSLISKKAHESEQGLVLGVSQSFGSLARTFGPIIGGLLYGFFPQLPFGVSGLTIFFLAILV